MFVAKNLFLFFLLLLFVICPGFGQPLDGDRNPVTLVGLTLEYLINNFGIPQSVYAVRGLEEWQDDVVFVYDVGDFYIYRNRVWQVGLRTLMGINIGDPGSAASLVLDGAPGFTRMNSPRDSVAYSMPPGSWPMILRCDFDDDGRIRGIFLFRSDL